MLCGDGFRDKDLRVLVSEGCVRLVVVFYYQCRLVFHYRIERRVLRLGGVC